MSGGCYRYIFDKDWEFVFKNIGQVKKAAGEAWFHGYEDVARALRSWYNDYTDDPAYTWSFEGDIEDQDFSPEDEWLEKEWEVLCPVIKGLSWWMAGDTGEERFQETVQEWKQDWKGEVVDTEPIEDAEDALIEITVSPEGAGETVSVVAVDVNGQIVVNKSQNQDVWPRGLNQIREWAFENNYSFEFVRDVA